MAIRLKEVSAHGTSVSSASGSATASTGMVISHQRRGVRVGVGRSRQISSPPTRPADEEENEDDPDRQGDEVAEGELGFRLVVAGEVAQQCAETGGEEDIDGDACESYPDAAAAGGGHSRRTRHRIILSPRGVAAHDPDDGRSHYGRLAADPGFTNNASLRSPPPVRLWAVTNRHADVSLRRNCAS